MKRRSLSSFAGGETRHARALPGLLLLVGCSIVAAGCVSTEALVPPDVTLVDVDSDNATSSEILVVYEISFLNDAVFGTHH